MGETGLNSLSMFPPGSKQSTFTLDITSTIGSVNSPSFTGLLTQPSSHLIISTMPQSSTCMSWMDAHTHRIQAGQPSGSNPDGCWQLARQSACERGETPFDYNQYNHQVGGSSCIFVCKANSSFRSVGMKSVLTGCLKTSRTELRTWVLRKPSWIFGGMTSSK